MAGLLRAEPPLPERNPLRAVTRPDASAPAWPRTLDDRKPSPPVTTWSEAEIKDERERCAGVLAGLAVVVLPAEPRREGECGAAAPYRLISVGRSPEVTFSPPSVVNCDMAAALARWLDTEVQPAARAHLSGPIIRISVASDYACRKAMGRRLSKLSEHALANALDIRDFVTERGEVADLKADWGKTERDIAAEVAAAAAKAKEKAALAAKAGPPPTTGPGAPVTPKNAAERTAADQGPAPRADTVAANRLGGPNKAKGEKRGQTSTLSAPSARREFLRRVHVRSCGIFKTVLGPEANEAHRDHFHVDLARRRSGTFCE